MLPFLYTQLRVTSFTEAVFNVDINLKISVKNYVSQNPEILYEKFPVFMSVSGFLKEVF